MDLKMKVRRNTNSSFQIADGKAVVMLAVNSNIFTLNEIGTVIWQLLDTPRTIEDLTAVTLKKFPDEDQEVIRKDILEFITDCVREKLLIQED